MELIKKDIEKIKFQLECCSNDMERQQLQKKFEEKKNLLKKQEHVEDDLNEQQIDETNRRAHLQSLEYQPLVHEVS